MVSQKSGCCLPSAVCILTMSNITLTSLNRTLKAKNEDGHLIYPEVFLDRQPNAEDEALFNEHGFDAVLVFIDGENTISVSPTVITLNEENNYFQSLTIQGEGAWSISGVVTEFIRLESSSGQLSGEGSARIDIMKAAALTERGEHSCYFTVSLANGEEHRVMVYITVNLPLKVNNKGNGETLTVNLNAANNYTQALTIIRDREWTVENVETGKIAVSPVSGNGAALPDFADTLTLTKSPTLLTTTATTTFQVVSVYQRVNVTVNITLTITGEFVDPLLGEEGATGTKDDAVYIYA